MCPFYNAQLFEITGTAKGVFTHSQSSCHIAKVVLTLWHDSRQIPIACDAPSRPTSRGFLPWRFADAGPGVRGAVIMGRHPKTFTKADIRLRSMPSLDVTFFVVATSNPFHSHLSPTTRRSILLIRSERSASAALIAAIVCCKVLAFDPSDTIPPNTTAIDPISAT